MRDERGTTLLLFPAAVLVLLVLAAIAVDLSTVHLARRELVRVASQAADDASSMIDTGAVRRSGATVLDRDTAVRVARYEMAVARLPGELVGTPSVEVDTAARTVTITASMRVDAFFGAVAGDAGHLVTVRVGGELVDSGP